MTRKQPTLRGAAIKHQSLGAILFLCLLAQGYAATSQHETFTTFTSVSGTEVEVPGLDQIKATLANPTAAGVLIDKAVQSGPLSEKGKDPKMEYCFIHLLRWSDTSTSDKPQVLAQNWYLYRKTAKGWSQEDFTTNKRLFGTRRVSFLFVHFNAAKMTDYKPVYDFTITKKTPANVAHLYALLASFSAGAGQNPTPSPEKGLAVKDTNWGGGKMNVQYVPSDIVIKSTFRAPANSATDQKLADDITFDNEGLYHWDVGFAVPVKRISELKLDSTSGTATPAKVSSTNVFAVLDGYLKPVDVKGNGFTAIPHPIAGIAFAKQPLSKLLVGGAWGPHVSEIYLGAMFVKQQEFVGSSSCSVRTGSALAAKTHYCPQFTIGINLSVSAIASKLGAPK